MKTVFITILQGVEAKNILRTNVLPQLLGDPDTRLVFFVRTPERAEYYRREFSDPRIIYETCDFEPSGFWERRFGRLKFHLLRTETTDLRRRMDLDSSGRRLAHLFGLVCNRFAARRSVRRIVRWCDRYLVGERQFGHFFDRYHPDAVFLAHLFDDAETALLREAKRRQVRTIGLVNSWDKLTARCTLRLLPDSLLVYNDIVRAEAIVHTDMAPGRIRVVGIPQYDQYVGYRPVPRAEFMRRAGLDPKKRFFLYAPMGETFSGADWEIIDLLHRWSGDGTLPADVEFLVRFQPNDFVDEGELANRPWLKFDRPGTRFGRTRGVDWDMSSQELRHLADTLAHAALLVCYASSISVDAAIFGKPVININFELTPARRMIQSPTQFYRMEHYAKALVSGGMRLVHSADELAHWIGAYLIHPELDAHGRTRLVHEQCGPFDGRAGARIAERIREARYT